MRFYHFDNLLFKFDHRLMKTWLYFSISKNKEIILIIKILIFNSLLFVHFNYGIFKDFFLFEHVWV